MCNTSFNLNASLSSNDSAACAFLDNLPDPSEKLSTFLNTLPPNEVVRFLFPTLVHIPFSVQCSSFLDMGSLPLCLFRPSTLPSRKAFFHLAMVDESVNPK